MATWHPSAIPHTNHSSERYWHGVSQISAHSNFEQPKVSVRTGPGGAQVPTAAQPSVSGGAQLASTPGASAWRADEHGGT